MNPELPTARFGSPCQRLTRATEEVASGASVPHASRDYRIGEVRLNAAVVVARKMQTEEFRVQAHIRLCSGGALSQWPIGDISP